MKTSAQSNLLGTIAFFALIGCNAGAGAPPPSITAGDGSGEAALSTDDCPATVPAALDPAADQQLKFKFHGTGVQVYVCDELPAGGFTWTFVNPQANLSRPDGSGDLIGTHFIGPTWQAADASNVVGKKVGSVTVDPTAIPWLLLTAASNMGPGRFADITSVQRLNTVGGLAPDVSTCTTATLGTISSTSYQADYFFYVQRDPPKKGNLQCK